MIVVDASLAAKWIFWEQDSDKALEFWNREAGNIAAPDLMAMEVAAAIVRRANVDKTLLEDMAEALEKLSRLMSGTSIQQFRMTTSISVTAARLGMALGHPLKDCVYLVLARALDCELLTCDRKFASKACEVWPGVRVFGD